MKLVDARGRFRLTITSLQEFACFCAIIRGDNDLTDEKLRDMTARLKKSTTAIAAAVAEAKPQNRRR